MQQWNDELLKYCGELLKPEDIRLIRKGTDSAISSIVIISYSIIEKIEENPKIKPEMFGIVIADESHNLKKCVAKKTLTVIPLLKKIKVAICLTGTPALNRPNELYTQLNGLFPFLMNDSDGFKIRYCDGKPSKFASHFLEAKGSSNEAELKLILESMVMIRRLKADVVNQLPTKCRQVIYINPDPKYASELSRIQKQNSILEAQSKDPMMSKEDLERVSNEKQSLLLHYYQMTGLAKVNAIQEYLSQLLEEVRIDRLQFQTSTEHVKECVDLTVDEEVFVPRKKKAAAITDDVEEETILVDSDEEEVSVFPLRHKLRKKHLSCDSPIDIVKVNDLQENNLPIGTDIADADDELCQSKSFQEQKSSVNTEEDSSKDIDIFIDNKFNGSSSEYLDENCHFETKEETSLNDNHNVNNGDMKKIGQKILVFAHHHSVMQKIEELLLKATVNYIRIDGRTPAVKKAKLIDKFTNDESVDIALLSITACGTGLNLTVANIAVFAELYWTPGNILQAEDRIHRIGQKSAEVRIIYLLGKNTADDIVWDQIQRKQNMLEATIGQGGNGLGNSSGFSKNQQSTQQPTLDRFVHAQQTGHQYENSSKSVLNPSTQFELLEVTIGHGGNRRKNQQLTQKRTQQPNQQPTIDRFVHSHHADQLASSSKSFLDPPTRFESKDTTNSVNQYNFQTNGKSVEPTLDRFVHNYHSGELENSSKSALNPSNRLESLAAETISSLSNSTNNPGFLKNQQSTLDRFVDDHSGHLEINSNTILNSSSRFDSKDSNNLNQYNNFKTIDKSAGESTIDRIYNHNHYSGQLESNWKSVLDSSIKGTNNHPNYHNSKTNGKSGVSNLDRNSPSGQSDSSSNSILNPSSSRPYSLEATIGEGGTCISNSYSSLNPKYQQSLQQPTLDRFICDHAGQLESSSNSMLNPSSRFDSKDTNNHVNQYNNFKTIDKSAGESTIDLNHYSGQLESNWKSVLNPYTRLDSLETTIGHVGNCISNSYSGFPIIQQPTQQPTLDRFVHNHYAEQVASNSNSMLNASTRLESNDTNNDGNQYGENLHANTSKEVISSSKVEVVSLTKEQEERIERNRLEALRRLQLSKQKRTF
jgi:hypothetical protein